MIRKSTRSLIVNALIANSGGRVESPWIDITSQIDATTRIQTVFLAVTNSKHPELIIEVADDRLGTNAATVLHAAGYLQTPTVTRVTHRHALTDRYVRVVVKNPGATVNSDLTVNAHIDLIGNIG